MRLWGFILTGLVIGLSICVWLTLTQPRTRGDQDMVQANPTPSQEALAPSPSSSSNAVVAGQASIKILPFSVTLTAADPITDLVYGEIKDGKNISVGFTTETLLAKYPACTAGALGTLVRVKAPTPSPSPSQSPVPPRSPTRTPANQPFKKTVGDYAYSYRTASFTCATDQAGRNAVVAATAALKNQALPTLNLAPAPTSSPSASPSPSPNH
jgi:hypothetical protein